MKLYPVYVDLSMYYLNLNGFVLDNIIEFRNYAFSTLNLDPEVRTV